MERRDSLKSMLIGSLAGGLLLTGCQTDAKNGADSKEGSSDEYGRTEKEKARDARIKGEAFFNEHEIATIASLCDLILPANGSAPSALDAGVPDFISFIAKDITAHQLPLRGGIMWLDHRAQINFENLFANCNAEQQKQLLDEIAYPAKATAEVAQGVAFFSLMRNLVLTGYYTTRAGLEDLGYQGNVPNVWDGVPEDVLSKHGLAYDPEWVAKCVNQERRAILAEWDEAGNLLT